nr:hypothetical protein GCM10020185_36750 [Pseudomonas brassicacearum subsp. brassicacearum]
MHTLSHIWRLGLKGTDQPAVRLRSAAVFLGYAFTVAIYMPAAGSVIGVHNASVAIVDEDQSHLSRQLAQVLQPPEFQNPVALPYAELDKVMDSGRYTFVINVPANFQADLLAGREPTLQLNVDATAMSQAFMGAGYIGRIFQQELTIYAGQAQTSEATPVRLTTRSLFNTNLEGGWFLAVIQIVNNITILAIILTGTALLREREHGTLDHLLVLPLTALEIMLAKNLEQPAGSGAVHLGVAGNHRQVCPGRTSRRLHGALPAGDRTLPVRQHLTGHLPRHPRSFDAAVRFAGDPGHHPDAAVVGRQHTAGQHAAMVAMGDARLALDAFRQPQRGDPVP